jgi:enoyl-CoA hydratase
MAEAAEHPSDDPNALVRYGVHGSVAVITLNRPRERHAVNAAVSAALEAAIDRLDETDGVWAAVLCAAPTPGRPVFCAGADLKAIDAGETRGIHTKRGGFAGIVFRDRVKPIVAAVDGIATAGGCEIALACDIVVATNRTTFEMAEVKRNLVANAGGLFRLPRVVGPSVAMEMMLTGAPLTAARAYELGLVSRLVEADELLSTALEIATRIAANGPLSVQASRRIMAMAFTERDETLKKLGYEASNEMFATADTTEGLRAFIEKREPRWLGR